MTTGETGAVPSPLPLERPLRLAVVGLGQIAELMLPAYAARPDVAVVGLCDPRTERLERWAERFPDAVLATDVGGGTSYSMLRTAAEGYKVLQLGGQSWPAAEAFYQMTLGNARALSLEHAIGSIEPGKDADLIILDSRATPAMAHRMERVDGDLDQELFVLVTLGDDRAVRQTYVAGAPRKT